MIEEKKPSSRRPVLVFARYFEPAFRAGGPVRTLSAQIDQANRCFDVRVITTNRDLRTSQPLQVESNEWVNRRTATVFYSSPVNPMAFIRALRSARGVHAQIIYVNSFFDLKFALLPILLSGIGFFGKIELLIAPRGEFGPGALGLKSAKKRMFLGLFNFMRMASGVTWHASTELEAKDIRKAIPRAEKIVVKEDETDLPEQSSPPHASSSSTPRAIFLGRISPMKGLDMLLQSLQMVDSPLDLDVYGPVDDVEYYQECLDLADLLKDKVKVSFRGEVPHAEVRETLAYYDLMILPSRGENFGHIIAEALSVSVPVMCSPNTPWTKTLISGGGAVVAQGSTRAWADAVTEYAELDQNERDFRKLQAGLAYDHWAKQRDHTSVFELLGG
jgi:glycosyltransferase involved in cell wall biosynthesis